VSDVTLDLPALLRLDPKDTRPELLFRIPAIIQRHLLAAGVANAEVVIADSHRS
jgi:hypothetical protein